jgi:diguanylate cyclase (GGDEF)-like protein
LTLKDPLTRLPNRLRFEQELAEILAREPGTTVLLMDLVGFQAVNDAYGYAGGDAVLAQVAARLREYVGAGGVLARVGDDEFALCLRDNDAAHATRTAIAVLQCLDEPVQIGEVDEAIGGTIGLAQTTAEPLEAGELIRRAHVALYAARRINEVYRFFDPETDDKVRERSFMDWFWIPEPPRPASAA